MEIPNNIQEMQPVLADVEGSGFVAIFEDGSQIDTTGDVDENGVTIGLGEISAHGGWAEVRISWSAVQAVADELNELLRQARKADWL